MPVRTLYFDIFRHICESGAQVDDSASSNTFSRLGRLMALMDLKTESGQSPAIDRSSGLPILKEVISIHHDIQTHQSSTPVLHTLQQKMLNDMLIKRRLPSKTLIRKMAGAVYQSALQEAQSVMDSEPVELNPVSFKKDTLSLSWDYWDGQTNQPVRIFAWFTRQKDRPLPEAMIRELGRKFSGSGFQPLALAVEIDQAIQCLRLKMLGKVVIKAFYSPIFTDLDKTHRALLDSLPDDQAWMVYWTIDTVKSRGTHYTRRFWIGPKVYYERFKSNNQDKILSERGASECEDHVLMPHSVYQKIVGDRRFRGLKNRIADYQVHILSQGDMTTVGK